MSWTGASVSLVFVIALGSYLPSAAAIGEDAAKSSLPVSEASFSEASWEHTRLPSYHPRRTTMPEYLATARNAKGRKVTERLDVNSADEAVQVLRDRGYDEIVLHTSDTEALYTKQKALSHFLSPSEYLWFRKMPPRLASFLILTIKIYQKGWYWNLAALAWLAYRSWRGVGWGPTDIGLVAYLVFPLFWALGAQFFRGAAGRYNRLIDAVSWGRWEEVLARADSVGGKVASEEVAFQKAKALAGLGRLEEALNMVKTFADGKKIPLWLYWSRLAAVYSTGKRPEESKAALEKALEFAPDNASLLVSKAEAEVWHRRNPKLARELLTRARAHAISELIQPHVLKTEGLIRLEEGHAREARELLEQAFEKANVFRHASPIMLSMLDKLHAALAVACAAEGDIDAARRHYQRARPRLVALRLDDELARCDEAVGLTPEGVAGSHLP
jgi:tetratricopeptide (TPR) repeat protein